VGGRGGGGICGVLARELFGGTFADPLATLDLSPAVHAALAAQGQSLGDVLVPAGATAAEHGAIEQALGEALVTAFRWAAVLAALLAAAGSLAAAVTIEAAPARAPAPGTAEVRCTHLELVRDVDPRTQGCTAWRRVRERLELSRLCLLCVS